MTFSTDRILRKAVMAAFELLEADSPQAEARASGALQAYVEVACHLGHLGPTTAVVKEAVLAAARVAGPAPAMAERRIWLDDVVDDAISRIDQKHREMYPLTKEE